MSYLLYFSVRRYFHKDVEFIIEWYVQIEQNIVRNAVLHNIRPHE